MTPRQRRMTLVIGIIVGVSAAGALALSAFRQNVTFFFDPTQVSAGEVPDGQRFRLGGMVTKGSVHRAPGSLEVRFMVTDFKHDVPVSYTGVLPDLFREGTGVVAHGKMTGGTFVADEVLAKHDEKYMPPEVAKSLKRRHGEARQETTDSGAQPQTATPAPGAAPSTTLNASKFENSAAAYTASPLAPASAVAHIARLDADASVTSMPGADITRANKLDAGATATTATSAYSLAAAASPAPQSGATDTHKGS